MKPDAAIKAEAELADFFARLDKFLYDVEPPLSRQDRDKMRTARALRNEMQDQRGNIIQLYRGIPDILPVDAKGKELDFETAIL